MEHIHLSIGKNLNRLRKNRGFSLDKVAEITGVSKAMLGQIERGESNPTVTTLWKIANGLHVSFTSLMENKKLSVSIIDRSKISPLKEKGEDYQVYPLFPFDPEKQFEIFSICLEAQCKHESEGHNKGVEEYIIVSKGVLEIRIEQETYLINQGNAIRFVADRPHCYYNPTARPLHYHVVIYYPKD